ncbi:hypothetical protein AN964_23215 [Heyndrickxia shackletonii]|uniref:Uncharacterized protein n=1 Tax=Heyndrickxia shackletonii TaxID=157838 RepID=A0A0Q3WRC9_9BACI|nr:hypothetical protein [Heyndrickxia shackletonii]KQL50564.1 hypothetical protein AN964_23215 [Heyndrickxia shackletonii]NEY98125.1 hypothetical protein [Heyndrickxia shackletonii]
MTKTINEITKSVVSQSLVRNAQERFMKDVSKKGGVHTQSLNFDLEKATLKEMDFTHTEDLKELGVVHHLEIPTNDGRIIYSFNDSAHSVQTYKNDENKKEVLLDLLKNNKDFNTIVEYVTINGGVLDYDSAEATNYKRELSDSDQVTEFNVLTTIVRDTNTNEPIGQIQYNDNGDRITLYLGEEEVSVSEGEMEVNAAASCLVKWMNCMLNCLCGSTVGSCAIAISGCIGACCGCSGVVGCLPCAGCMAGVGACGAKCGPSGGGK